MPPTRVPARPRSKDDEKRRPNALFHGDNLEILLRYVEDSSIDLIYLDPPFQSGRDYNLLFKREDGSRPPAQIKAFTDTWRWDAAASAAFHEVLESGTRVGNVLELMRRQLDTSPMLAYLSMMAIRLIELHRVLKPTGSLYLHCDPTASHYLKLVLDATFGAENFRAELIWKRSSAHGGTRGWGPIHDSLLMYTRSESFTWNPQLSPEADDSIAKWYVHDDKRGRYKRGDLTGAGTRGGASGLPWRGFNPTEKGRHWAVPREIVKKVTGSDDVLSPQASLDLLFDAERIIWPKKKGGQPMLKRYLHEAKGVPAGDVVTDIPPLSLSTSERLGYPTQKPLALLERIIAASSNEGDQILDPFCGCGTTIDAAQKMKRRWIGIDVAQQAIDIIEERLEKQHGELVKATYELVREPQDLDGARALALQDRHQFEKWAVRLVGGDSDDKAKGADRGIDGLLQFQEALGAPTRKVIISVKSGHTTVRDVRDLVGTVGREKAAIGVLIVLNEPTGPMRAEASSADFYYTTHSNQPERFSKIQILTVGDILEGEMIRAPINFKRRGPKRATPQIEFKFGGAKAG